MENKTAQDILNEIKTSDWDKKKFKKMFYPSFIKTKSTNEELNEELKKIKDKGINQNRKIRNTTQADKDKDFFKSVGVDYYDN